MPDNFTRQEENAATQWVNLTIMLHYAQMHMTLLFYSISHQTTDRFTRQGESCALMGITEVTNVNF